MTKKKKKLNEYRPVRIQKKVLNLAKGKKKKQQKTYKTETDTIK